MRFKILIALIFIVSYKQLSAQVTYPDAHFPADTPVIFAKGILSDGLSNRDFTISPTGDEIFFTIQHPRFLLSAIIRIVKVNGVWGKPEVAPFSGDYRDLEATFAPDGKTIFFSSDRPLKAGSPPKDFDIWKVVRGADGKWGTPENLGPTVNSNKDEFYPSVAKSGNLYFTAEIPTGKGSEDIVVCKKTATGYEPPVSLPEDISTKFDEFNAFVDPDEQFIIFSSNGRTPNKDQGDLYMSKKSKGGTWMPCRHLPSPINSPYIDYCPYVTADKKYLIFTSNRFGKEWYISKKDDYEDLKIKLGGAGNGLDDIYWVKFNPDW